MATELRWDPPGEGPWELETAHFPRPMPHFARESIRQGFMQGFSEGTARYGLLLSHFEGHFVNGFLYQQPIAFGAPKGAMGPPPKPILWLLTRLHPAMRARIRVSAEAFESKLWRKDLANWDAVDKPKAIARHQEMLAVPIEDLDDAALAAHLAECDAHAKAMIVLHHQYTIPCILPVGDFLAHTVEWTGLDAGTILDCLRGSTPISKGILADEFSALVEALKADANGRAILAGSDAQAIVQSLCERDDELGTKARAYLGAVRHRALSYDLGTRAAGEQPDLLVGAIRAAVAGAAEKTADMRARIADLRGKVPPEHQSRFDELLEEARAINRLRDERGIFADGFAVGIARRGALEAGRRLAERGLVKQADHAVDLELAEMQSLLSGGGGPSGDEVAARVNWRETKTVADAPPFLRAMPAPPPEIGVLPVAARRPAAAVDTFIGNLFKESERESEKTIIRGTSVNQGVYEGTARLVEDASHFGRLQQGDVLVTRATAPYFNVVLPLLGALVTDRGGQLCHAAIVAREYGIPGIVGTKVATATIPDGARVRVDGTKGEVTILG